MFLFGMSLGFLAGCVLTGEVAHRWPSLFAQVVKVANKAADAGNALVDKAKDAAK